MKILLAAHGFPPTHSAGAERRAERMARWLVAQGHHVEVIAVESERDPDFAIKTTEENGITVHRLHYDITEGDHFRNYYDNPKIGQAFKQLLAERTFDLLHVISGYYLGGQAIETAKAFGLPVAITLTEYWFICQRLNLIQPTGELCSGPDSDKKCMRCYWESKRAYLIPATYAPAVMKRVWPVLDHAPHAAAKEKAFAHRRVTLQRALNAADLVICPSEFLISKYGEYGFNTQNYVFMRQGLEIPDHIEQIKKAAPAADVLRLVYIGQIQPHKGVDLLVDSVIELLEAGKPVSLDLWGSETQAPAYTKRLKARTQSYTAIRWNGRYTGSKVWDVLANADALVIPSRWYENSPNVILEAYTTGIPVIATNLGGMAELVEHEKSGLVFNLNDQHDLTRQLDRLMSEDGLLTKLRAGVPAVKTINDEMAEVMQHYQQLLGQQAEIG